MPFYVLIPCCLIIYITFFSKDKPSITCEKLFLKFTWVKANEAWIAIGVLKSSMLALPIEGYTYLIFLTNYNYNYQIFCFCRHGVCENPFQEVEDINNQSVVYVGVDNTLAGLIYFEDQIREDARQVVESLSCQGINVYMLSGDRKKNAEHVASLVGIPKEKVRKL